MQEFIASQGSEVIRLLWEHIYMSLISLGLGVIVAVPLGIFLSQVPKVANVVISIVSVLQTIPTLALLALMIPFLGVGKVPAIFALFIYSLLPILRNTYLGMSNVNPDLLDAAKGMGLKRMQIIRQVQLPLAVPVIMAGIRLSTVYVIAWTTLASYIGGGGLGDMIFNGLNLFRPDLILGGTIPVTILAVIVDLVMARVEDWVTPTTSSKKGDESLA
ncbi:osmoprotectant transport system permease protein [Aerococcus sp. 150760007-1]|uniref:ABC transporter permease n=1 Tax=Aerococcus urinaeequi TaxID=51665 RepID=A0ABR5ZYP4_9LACT|nr:MULTISPECIES: ABC transporter permease [Lactobacillales]KAF3301902.1 ABC transporter permease subunit [Carnobacterium sp. PL17RED31]QGS36402.1 ABC transporter permease subunit [Aerococcus viridans]KAF3298681.1 ABC transporter permease subunit [Carnobacterium sp. PL26RED25]KAF3301831.1 ABC transporter permease subunit [Carnobacterium sp. PL12RED10]KAF3303905.1 ABC transporter permease subunit [Carnobacterium sp. PL24RED07]